jgi:UTP-glucose-1-phosphate uridylyltransferase
MIIGKAKRAIEEHFDRISSSKPNCRVKPHSGTELISRISEIANIFFIYQKELNGWRRRNFARSHVGRSPSWSSW